MRKISFFTALCLMNLALFAQENYELRVLTFEDEDVQFTEYTLDYIGADIRTWSDLIDESQYGGPLLYGEMGSGMDTPYKWYDEGNTELMHESPMGYGTYCYWSGGHAISNYVCDDVSSDYRNYGDMNGQLTVCSTSGHNGSSNFAVHYGYMDGSPYNFTEELPALSFGDGVPRVVDHMYVHMNAYLLNCILHGNELTEPVGDIDYVKLEAIGYDENENETGKLELDICTSPIDFIMDWTYWDLSPLGKVARVEFNVLGTNDNGYGFSQPAYFVYDDVAVRFEKEVVKQDPILVELSETACDAYTWNQKELTESGVYVDTLLTEQGRDSIVTLHLTIHSSSVVELSATTDKAYIWNGDLLTESGVYINHYTSQTGCDSIVKFHLTIDKVNKPETDDEEKDYELRILTFEDEDTKFDPFYMGDSYLEVTQWSDLVDDAQMEGTLLYGGPMWSMSEPYWWYDQNNTELKHEMPYNFNTYCYAGGGHAISNYASTDYLAAGDQYHQLTVYGEEGQGGYDGSANFVMHFGYIDGSSWNDTENLSTLTFADDTARVIDHMYVNNGTYALNCYINGNGLTASLGENDWVKLVAMGFDANGEETGPVEFFLAKGSEVVVEWTKWDLSPLGEVIEVQFNVLGSNDNGYGFSQPAYFAYDNVAVRFPNQQPEVEIPTGMSTVDIPSTGVHKLLRNGQIWIIRNGKVYNLNGIQLQ